MLKFRIADRMEGSAAWKQPALVIFVCLVLAVNVLALTETEVPGAIVAILVLTGIVTLALMPTPGPPESQPAESEPEWTTTRPPGAVMAMLVVIVAGVLPRSHSGPDGRPVVGIGGLVLLVTIGLASWYRKGARANQQRSDQTPDV